MMTYLLLICLPLTEEIKLQVYLKQIPQYWDIPKIKYLSNRNKLEMI